MTSQESRQFDSNPLADYPAGMEQLEELAGQLLSLDHWPWLAVCSMFAIIGQFTSTRLFTKARAYSDRGKIAHAILYWGRETLPLHPILAGIVLAFFWPDPEGKGWALAPTAAYFGSAGVASIFAWVILKARAKKKGLNLQLPGASTVPTSVPDMRDPEMEEADTDPPGAY